MLTVKVQPNECYNVAPTCYKVAHEGTTLLHSFELMQHAEHPICIPCCHFFLRHSRRSIYSFHTIHYQIYPKVKVFRLASQSRASCCFYSTFLYLLKSFCSSVSFLGQQMRNHGTHRERLKHTHPP